MHRPARLPDECYRSRQACFITVCTSYRQPRLVYPDTADAVTEQLMKRSAANAIEIAAYCLMPDHLHALLLLDGPRGHIRLCIERFKQITGYAHARRTGGRLWQPSYFDHTLRSEDAVLPTVAYIVNNPVLAGYVALPETWPYWGSSIWERPDLLDAIANCGQGSTHG